MKSKPWNMLFSDRMVYVVGTDTYMMMVLLAKVT